MLDALLCLANELVANLRDVHRHDSATSTTSQLINRFGLTCTRTAIEQTRKASTHPSLAETLLHFLEA